MDKRKTTLPTHGYAVLAIPDCGLFVNNRGEIETGSSTPVIVSEITLFTKRVPAEKFSERLKRKWENGDAAGHDWFFPVIPVLVSEAHEREAVAVQTLDSEEENGEHATEVRTPV